MIAMARKPPRLPNVKHVRKVSKAGLRWYSYYNTGQKVEGKPVYASLPQFGSVGFFDSLAAYEAARTRRATPRYTVASLCDEYLATREFEGKSAGTQRRYTLHLAKVKEAWGFIPVDALDPAKVRQVLAVKKYGAATQNGVVAALGVAYRWGRKFDRTSQNPTRDIEREKNSPHLPWPDDLLAAALECDNQPLRLGVHLLYFTGQRIGDVCKMRWSDIRNGRIYVVQEKTGKKLSIPLIAELRDELAGTPRAGLEIMHGVNSNALRLMVKAFTAGRSVKRVPHGLRKNAVNSLLLAGCTVQEVSSVTGQSFRMVEHYAAQINQGKLSDAAILKFERARA